MKITAVKPADINVDIQMTMFEALAFYKLLRSIGGSPDGVRRIFAEAGEQLGSVLNSALKYPSLAHVTENIIQYNDSNRAGNSIYFTDESYDVVEKKVRAALNL